MSDTPRIDDAMERALDVLESPENLSEKELQTMLEDEECLQACRDLMEGSRVLMADMPQYAPNVECEWEKFNKRHHTMRRRHIWRKSMIAGIAAILTTVVLFSYFLFFHHQSDVKPVTVFVADTDFQQVTLQTESGKMITLEGNKELTEVNAHLQENKLDYKATASPAEEIEMHTLSTPRGTDFKVLLTDGTEVWLNAESRLEYPAIFNGKERLVWLHGEAYFKVAKDENRPFIIQTNNIKTRVLGTELNVRNHSITDSHVTLIEGSVEVCDKNGNNSVRLTPGEDAHLLMDGTFAIKKVDVDAYIYWKEGYFYFDNVTLLDIMQRLGKWYNVSVQFENHHAMNYRMHFCAERNAGLENTIKLLNRMKKVKIVQENDTLIIR